MDYIREEADTDKQADAQRCEKCGQIDIGQTGEYPCEYCGLPRMWDAANVAAELKRAEAAAVETCRRVAQSLESVEDAKRVQPEEPSAAA